MLFLAFADHALAAYGLVCLLVHTARLTARVQAKFTRRGV